MIKCIRIALAALAIAFALAFGAHSFSSTQVAGTRPPKGGPAVAGIRPVLPALAFELSPITVGSVQWR